MRALGALVLALTMLLKAEAAGLADQRINQGVKQAMASLADNRPVVLAKSTYATYGTGVSIPTLMSFTFPPASLAAGDQLHISVSGLFINNSGGQYNVGAYVRVTSGNSFINLSGPAVAGPSASDYAFHTDIFIAVSTTGASGSYVPSTGSNPNSQSSQLYMNRSNTSISFTGTSVTVIGGVQFFGPTFGGFIQTNAPAGPGSTIWSTKAQQSFDASQPILVEVIPASNAAPSGATSYLSIVSGSMVGM